MSTPATVPMLDPQGVARMIPAEAADQAAKSGWEPATKALDPKGVARYIPSAGVGQAKSAGWTVSGEDFTVTPKGGGGFFSLNPEAGQESFTQTMDRAAKAGEMVTPEQIKSQTIKGAEEAPVVLAAAPAMGFAGAAALGGPVAEEGMTGPVRALYQMAVKHLAGNVLPGMEEEAAKQTLLRLAPKVLDAATKLGIGAGGLTYLWKAVTGGMQK